MHALIGSGVCQITANIETTDFGFWSTVAAREMCHNFLRPSKQMTGFDWGNHTFPYWWLGPFVRTIATMAAHSPSLYWPTNRRECQLGSVEFDQSEPITSEAHGSDPHGAPPCRSCSRNREVVDEAVFVALYGAVIGLSACLLILGYPTFRVWGSEVASAQKGGTTLRTILFSRARERDVHFEKEAKWTLFCSWSHKKWDGLIHALFSMTSNTSSILNGR